MIGTLQKTDDKTAVLLKRIGSTNYRVRIHFSDTGTETIGDKIVRLIQNEALTNAPDCGKIEAPQMGRPPGRGSS